MFFTTQSFTILLIPSPVFTVGEDVLADTLMRYMKAKGVEVELRQDKRGPSAMAGFRALHGNLRFSVISVLLDRC